MKPLSPMDQTFLWLERRNQPMHVGGLQLITPPPDAPPDFVQRIAERIRNPAEAVPPFNQRLVQRFGMWFWTSSARPASCAAFVTGFWRMALGRAFRIHRSRSRIAVLGSQRAGGR